MDKTRNVPHQIGNYPLFIYIPILSSNKYTSIAKAIQSQSNDSNNMPLEAINSYHLSLSSTYYLKLVEIERFVDPLRNTLSTFNKFPIAITNHIKYFSNEYKNRHFIGIEIKKSKQLMKISQAIDDILNEYGLNEYIIPIEDKCYHISLLWDTNGKYCLSETELNEVVSKEVQVIKVIKVDSIKAKIGSKVYSIDLK